MSYRKITVPMSENEQRLLREMASAECRTPRAHARYIILRELGLVSEQKNNSSVTSCEAKHAAVIPTDR